MEKYILYKENKVSGKFSISDKELRKQFAEWMKKQEKDWLKYYSGHLFQYFVMATDGLNSVPDEPDIVQKLEDNYRKLKWDYLESIGIK